MRNTFRYISAILTAALVSGSVMTAWAQTGKKTYTDEEKAAIKTKKQVIDNGDGSYQLKLETWVAGDSSTVTKKTTKSVPLDIVLLLDVSGSMRYNMSGSQTNNVPEANQRITALKNAVNNFVGTIKENGTTNSVTHRISLVKFSANSYTQDTKTSQKTIYYPMSSASYSYNGYGNSSYYYKDGDNYYQVYRETGTGAETYTARNRANYSYSGYGNNQYYYLHNGQYCLVERGGGNNNRNLHFTYNGTTYYLVRNTTGLNPGGKVSDTPETGRGDNNYLWQGVLYSKSSTTVYRLYYQDASGVKNYLTGTSTTTNAPTNIENAGTTIWTGALYTAETATTPDNIIEGNSNNKTQVVKNFTDVNEAGATALTTATNGLTANGATYANYGMELVKLVFSESRAEALKVLILFTDGDPGQSGFDSSVANAVIKSSRLLKDQGVKVYTIGIFSNPNSNETNYMNNTSSNYPYATSLTDNGTTRATGDFYYNVTSASELENVFQTISEEATTSAGGEGITLDVEGESAVHLADIVTSSFKVPQGNNSVTLKMQYLDTLILETPADTSEYVWRAEEDVPSTVTVNVIENADKTSTIDISGFDFSTNWVGPIFHEVVEGSTTKIEYDKSTVKHGAKLVVYVEITPDPEDEGGLVPTNTDNSGVYVGGVKITDDKLKDYITPAPVFTPMDLKIEIEGLGENENAIFNVKGGDLGENGMNIILTSTTEGSVASATIAKVPLNDADGHPITYTVTLDEKWIWAYTAAEATNAPAGDKNYKTGYTVKEHALYSAEKNAEGEIVNYTTNHIFKFKVTPKEGVSGHGENFKNNEFKIMPKNGSTE